MSVGERSDLRVLVVLHGHEHGGVRTHLLTDLAYADTAGIKFEYLCLQPGPMYDELGEKGANVSVIGGSIPRVPPRSPIALPVVWLRWGPKLRSTYRLIRAALRARAPATVYTHHAYLHVLVGRAARGSGCLSVGRLPNMLNRRRLLGIPRMVGSTILAWGVHRVITISNAARNSLWGPARRKAVMIYNGLDVDRIREFAEGVAKAPGRIVLVGRFTPGKNHEEAIRAIAILKQRGVACSLDVVGGPVEDGNTQYQRLVSVIDALDVRDRVCFRGWMSPPYEAIAAAEVCLNCSVIEGFGYVVAEAMACGTALVVADSGAPAELVRHDETGLHYLAGDPASLATAIETLLRSAPLREQLTRAALDYARRELGIAERMSRLRACFEETRAACTGRA